MANYLLDTNHLSMLVNVGHPLRTRIIRQRQIGDEFSIATPALAEFLFGIQIIKHARENVNQWQNLQELFSYYDVRRGDAEQSARLQVDLRRRGKQLGLADSLIAVVALRYQLILLTTDQDFNAISGLAIENWLSPG